MLVCHCAQSIQHHCFHLTRGVRTVHLPDHHRYAARLTLGDPADIIFKPPCRHPGGFTQFAVRGGHRADCRSGAPDEAPDGIGGNRKEAPQRASFRVLGAALGHHQGRRDQARPSGIRRRSPSEPRRRTHRRHRDHVPSGDAPPRHPGSRRRQRGLLRTPGRHSTRRRPPTPARR